jgi:hypothetical protein
MMFLPVMAKYAPSEKKKNAVMLNPEHVNHI